MKPNPSSLHAAGKRGSALLLALLVLTMGASVARMGATHHHSRRPQAAAGNFDYYVLSLSWAPAFCSSHGGAGTSRECDPSRHVGFIVHGLWPQGENRRVENCGNVPPVSESIVNLMLPVIPSPGLIQHEWQTHGSCTGLSASDYFALVRSDYANVHVPAEFKSPSQQQQKSTASIEQDFAAASSLAGPSSVRVACSGQELTEVRLCLTKDGHSRACSDSVGECNSGTVTILPVH